MIPVAYSVRLQELEIKTSAVVIVMMPVSEHDIGQDQAVLSQIGVQSLLDRRSHRVLGQEPARNSVDRGIGYRELPIDSLHVRGVGDILILIPKTERE